MAIKVGDKVMVRPEIARANPHNPWMAKYEGTVIAVMNIKSVKVRFPYRVAVMQMSDLVKTK